jgi:hypothetical protein
MSASLPLRAIFAVIALVVAPAIAGAQAPQTKECKDGTTSSKSYFACWGHGGVDTARAAVSRNVTSSKHQSMQPMQAGAPRSKTARKSTRGESKSAHHAPAKHHDRTASAKPQDSGHHLWPWGHKKAKTKDAKKAKKRNNSALPVPERPNGRPR